MCILCFFVAQSFYLYLLTDESRMHSLSIAAARTNLPSSPAMLITRPRRVHRRHSAQFVNRQLSLGSLEGGQVESAEVCGAPGCFCGLGGFLTS